MLEGVIYMDEIVNENVKNSMHILTIDGVDCYEKDGIAYLKLETVARGLGFTQEKNRSEYVRWDRVQGYLSELGFPHKWGKKDFIPENVFYRLAMKAKNEVAEKFQAKVADEIIPTIRKTGGYVNNDDLFINTYLPFADDSTKLLFSTTLETVRKQNELIKTQQAEIVHKQEVINGLTDDIDIYKKRDIINRICKRSHGNYASRYRELYKCFLETEGIDLEARCEGYNLRQDKKKDQLTTIKYAEKYGHIDKLYSCCIKLYETEVKTIISQLNKVQS